MKNYKITKLNKSDFSISDNEWNFENVSKKIKELENILSSSNGYFLSSEIQEIVDNLILNRNSYKTRVPSWYFKLEIPSQLQMFANNTMIDFGAEKIPDIFHWKDVTTLLENDEFINWLKANATKVN